METHNIQNYPSIDIRTYTLKPFRAATRNIKKKIDSTYKSQLDDDAS